MLNTNPIKTSSVRAISESLQIGQSLINGSNRVFRIESLNAKQICLVYSDAIETRRSILSREVFAKLVYMNNYMQVKTANPLNEAIEATKTGGTRLLVKPAKFQL
jgi:hypothetical protein